MDTEDTEKTEDKENSVHDMTEISEFFLGNRNWGGEYEDQDLAEWFGKIADAIEEFEFKNTTKVGRKIQKMIVALEDLQLQHHMSFFFSASRSYSRWWL